MVFLQILIYLVCAGIVMVAPLVIASVLLGENTNDPKAVAHATKSGAFVPEAAATSTEQAPTSDRIPVWIAPTTVFSYEEREIAQGKNTLGGDDAMALDLPQAKDAARQARKPPIKRRPAQQSASSPAGRQAMNSLQQRGERRVYDTPPLTDD